MLLVLAPLHRLPSPHPFHLDAVLPSMPIYVVHQRLCHTHPHQLHRLRSHLLHRNRDRWDVVVCVSVPNTSIDYSSRSTEKDPAQDSLLYRSLQTGAPADPPDVEPGSPVASLLPIFTNDSSAREHTGPPI
jgi:hypothetical protein